MITGGERSWVSAAVRVWTTIIGPPHLGQDQRSLGPVVEACCSVCGAPPSSWKESGKVVARLRLARKPKLRMRTKPFGSRCKRKRRKNSSSYMGDWLSAAVREVPIVHSHLYESDATRSEKVSFGQPLEAGSPAHYWYQVPGLYFRREGEELAFPIARTHQ